MILVDTSVWIDHLRRSNGTLSALLNTGQTFIHPFVIGELALGNLRQRSLVLDALQHLPQCNVATDLEALHFIEQHTLFGKGIGYVDVHLLAAVRLTPRALLWTQDKRLLAVAKLLGLAADNGH